MHVFCVCDHLFQNDLFVGGVGSSWMNVYLIMTYSSREIIVI